LSPEITQHLWPFSSIFHWKYCSLLSLSSGGIFSSSQFGLFFDKWTSMKVTIFRRDLTWSSYIRFHLKKSKFNSKGSTIRMRQNFWNLLILWYDIRSEHVGLVEFHQTLRLSLRVFLNTYPGLSGRKCGVRFEKKQQGFCGLN